MAYIAHEWTTGEIITSDKLNHIEDGINALQRRSGLTKDAKEALLTCFRKVAWIDSEGQEYYDALHDALFPEIVSISAVFSPGDHEFHTTDTLDDLKPYLSVFATMSDESIEEIIDYTLSGSMAVGTNTITVSYNGFSTTFNVAVIPESVLVSISAIFDTSAEITTNDSLEDLRQYLTVTAHYDSGDDVIVTGYTLSGSLHAGQNTITVTYNNKTTTFTVNVIELLTAVFDAGGNTIYTDDTLDSLKQYLTVTYHENGTQVVLDDNDYTLSGSLTEGTSVITISYSDLVTTVNVTGVVDFYNQYTWQYPSTASNALTKMSGNPTFGTVSPNGATINTRATLQSYRRAFVVNKGKNSGYQYYNTEPVALGVYPIPVPNNAVRAVATILPSEKKIYGRILQYDESTEKYTQVVAQVWDGGSITLSFTADTNLYLVLGSAQGDQDSEYTPEPSSVIVEFYNE